MNKRSKYILAGDVGATKTVLALYESGGFPREPVLRKRYHSLEYGSLDAVVNKFVDHCGITPCGAVLGVAGPVDGNSAHLTNLGWDISGVEIAENTGIEKVGLLNDLATSIFGIDVIQEKDFLVLIKGVSKGMGTRGIMSPGTGLGQCAAVWNGERYFPVATEGGHSGFAPFNKETARLAGFMIERGINSNIENVCSGIGIRNLYLFCCEEYGAGKLSEEDVKLKPETVPEIIEHALAGNCGICLAAIRLFLDILASEAGNFALRFMASGGIYIGGGITPRLKGLLDLDRFFKYFQAKGSMSYWLNNIPVSIVLDGDLPLYGAAVLALNKGL